MKWVLLSADVLTKSAVLLGEKTRSLASAVDNATEITDEGRASRDTVSALIAAEPVNTVVAEREAVTVLQHAVVIVAD